MYWILGLHSLGSLLLMCPHADSNFLLFNWIIGCRYNPAVPAPLGWQVPRPPVWYPPPPAVSMPPTVSVPPAASAPSQQPLFPVQTITQPLSNVAPVAHPPYPPGVQSSPAPIPVSQPLFPVGVAASLPNQTSALATPGLQSSMSTSISTDIRASAAGYPGAPPHVANNYHIPNGAGIISAFQHLFVHFNHILPPIQH